jgi:spermidine/putrescine transport system permease protein
VNNQRRKQFFTLPLLVFLIMFVIFPLCMLFINAVFDHGHFTLKYIRDFCTDGYSFRILGRSLLVALAASIICILIAYPVAYILALTKFRAAPTILLLFIMPMWINTLLRTLATKDLIDLLGIQYGYGTLIFGLVVEYLPFMIMPIYIVLKNIDKKLIEASKDLGANNFTMFLKVILPLSVPGILSGFLMVFTPAVSTYFMSQSQFLGSVKTQMFGQLLNAIWSTNFGKGSVSAIVLLAVVGVSVFITNRFTKIGNQRGGLW